MIDKKAFTPMFLEGCSPMELVALQHELRESCAIHPEDRPYLDQVLAELKRRSEAPQENYCEICAPQHLRLQGHRCREHQEPK